jgi:hypothetical protein
MLREGGFRVYNLQLWVWGLGFFIEGSGLGVNDVGLRGWGVVFMEYPMSDLSFAAPCVLSRAANSPGCRAQCLNCVGVRIWKSVFT